MYKQPSEKDVGFLTRAHNYTDVMPLNSEKAEAGRGFQLCSVTTHHPANDPSRKQASHSPLWKRAWDRHLILIRKLERDEEKNYCRDTGQWLLQARSPKIPRQTLEDKQDAWIALQHLPQDIPELEMQA